MFNTNKKKGIVRFKLISVVIVICCIITFNRKEMLEIVIELGISAGINEKGRKNQQNQHTQIEKTLQHV